MNFFSPAEIAQNSALSGVKKAGYPVWKLVVLGVLSGAILALAAAAANTATFALANPSLVRLLNGVIFPCGLFIIVLLGAELFTGNCLLSVSLLAGEITLPAMLRNWFFVYLGNFIGGVMVAAGMVWGDQLGLGGGELAAYTIGIAAAKCALPFSKGLILGIFCNLLVCFGVLMSSAGKELSGKFLGAYVPVLLFVVCGFEHCIANLYYIPAGLFAVLKPEYLQKAAQAGVDVSALGWGNFALRNLLPVTIGNIIGGVALGAALWVCWGEAAEKNAPIQEKKKTAKAG